MSNQQSYSLVNVILLESTFKREWVLNLNDPNFKGNTDIQVSSQKSIEHLSVIVDLKYHAGIDDNSPEITSTIKMVGVFIAPENPQLPIETFININGPAIIFPFLREHLASISIKAGVNPILLQPVNFVKNNEVQKDTSSPIAE